MKIVMYTNSIKIFICIFVFSFCATKQNYIMSSSTIVYAKSKYNEKKHIKIVKQEEEYNTYRINQYYKSFVSKKDRNKPLKLFIDIPTNLSYKYSKNWTGGGYYVFSNDSEFVILRIFNLKMPDIQNYSGLYVEKNVIISKIEKRAEGREIKENMYYGVFVKENYLLYYYNVKEKDIELFEKSIKSLRYKK